MKYECEVIKDLIPLVNDGVASKESTELVRKHLDECDACRRYSEKMSSLPFIEEVKDDVDEEQEKACFISYKKKIVKRRFKVGISILVGCIIALTAWTVLLAGAFGMIYVMGKDYSTQDISEYRQFEGHISGEAEGINSKLFILPDKIPQNASQVEYSYNVTGKGFDNSYLIELSYTLDDEMYQREKERIADIKCSYDGLNQKILTGMLINNEEVLIASYAMDHTYEYVVFDDESSHITYVYSRFGEVFGYEEPTTSDKSLEPFSIYYFDEQIGFGEGWHVESLK